jgi:hypothetical protein
MVSVLTINGFLGMLKRGKIQIVVKTETIQEKEDDKNLRTVLVFLLSVSLSLFFSIGGDLSKIGNGFDIQRLLIWVMIFPFVFTLLYILMRKK